MSDHQRTIEFLRDFRASGVQAVTDDVREAAAAYATLCATANDRLRQCAMLLQRGLRAEAVHLADTPPNLLDLVAALDLPDPEGWAEICQRNDMPVPPPLQLDRAAQLNDAYGQDQPLQQLYARHRRLALARGPVAERLDVMRQLASADPGPFWEKDIRVFEQARFKELRVGFAVAAKERSVPAFKSLAAEVLQAPWYEPVPSDLGSMAREIDERAQQAQANLETSQLLAKLRSAYAAKSFSECSALLEQLRDQSATLGTAVLDEESANDIRSIAAWVQQQNQSLARKKAYTDACDSLSDALDTHAKDRELVAAYNGVVALGKPAPTELQRHYEARLKERAHTAKWRSVWAVGAVAAVLAIGLGVFYWQTQQGIAKEWARRIEKSVADRDVDLATQLISEQERLAPRASADADVASAKRSAAVLAQQFERDRDWVKGMLSILGGASEKTLAALGDSADPDEWWAATLAADEALGNYGRPQDVQRMDPRNQVAAAADRLQKEREALRSRYAAWLVAQINAAASKAGEPTVAPRAADLATADSALALAQKELGALMPQLDRGGEAARTASEQAAATMAAVRSAIQRGRDEYNARQAIAHSAGSVASARQALQQFVARFADSALGADFTKSAAALEIHETIDRFAAMTALWISAPAPPNEKTARQRLDAVRTFIGNNPRCPLIPELVGYSDYLQQAASAMAIPNAWQLEMGEILSSPLMSELCYLEATDKTRFYVLGDPAVQQQGVGARVRWIFDTLDPQNLARKKTITLPPPKALLSEKPTLLPHAVFVRDLTERMKTVDDRSWDTWGIDLVDRLIAADKIDPVVRAILLRDALRATARVDGWAIGGLYDRSIAELDRQRLEGIVWYDLLNPVPPVTLENLRTIVAKVPKGDVPRKLITDRRAQLLQVLRQPLVGTAMLLKDEEGKWRLEMAPGTPAATTALAVRSAIEASPAPAATPATVPSRAAELVKVATYSGDAWVIDEAAVRELPQGSVVFLSK